MYDLIQRLILKDESGVNPSPMHPLRVGDIRFDGVFDLDYMGDSVLEDQELLRRSLQEMQAIDLQTARTLVRHRDVRRPMWYLAPEGFGDICTDAWWRALFDDEYISALFRLWPEPEASWVRIVDRAVHDLAWWSPDVQVAWTFSEATCRKLRHAFGQVDLVRR